MPIDPTPPKRELQNEFVIEINEDDWEPLVFIECFISAMNDLEGITAYFDEDTGECVTRICVEQEKFPVTNQWVSQKPCGLDICPIVGDTVPDCAICGANMIRNKRIPTQ